MPFSGRDLHVQSKSFDCAQIGDLHSDLWFITVQVWTTLSQRPLGNQSSNPLCKKHHQWRPKHQPRKNYRKWYGEHKVALTKKAAICTAAAMRSPANSDTDLELAGASLPCLYIHFIQTLSMLSSSTLVWNAHAPTEKKDGAVRDGSYTKRKDAYDRYPAHKAKIILGNFNAKVWLGLIFGPTIAQINRHETSSNNGLRLIDFNTARKMIVRSIRFIWSYDCPLFKEHKIRLIPLCSTEGRPQVCWSVRSEHRLRLWMRFAMRKTYIPADSKSILISSFGNAPPARLLTWRRRQIMRTHISHIRPTLKEVRNASDAEKLHNKLEGGKAYFQTEERGARDVSRQERGPWILPMGQ